MRGDNMICYDLNTLKNSISEINPDVIIVEGYNGVGKSRVIDYLQNLLDVHAYRPDYVGWFRKVPRDSRWIASLAFLDIVKNQEFKLDHKLLLDRGFLSGAVYNNDMELAIVYKDFLFNCGTFNMRIRGEVKLYLYYLVFFLDSTF